MLTPEEFAQHLIATIRNDIASSQVKDAIIRLIETEITYIHTMKIKKVLEEWEADLVVSEKVR